MSGMRRSTIATSAWRVCSCAIASCPPEHAIDVEPGAPREPADDVENALFVVDDDEHRRLTCHTHSLETARTADRMARN